MFGKWSKRISENQKCLKLHYASHSLFPSELRRCKTRKNVKVKSFNWLGRPQDIKIFDNECDIRNQRIKKQQDRSMEKNLRH